MTPEDVVAEMVARNLTGEPRASIHIWVFVQYQADPKEFGMAVSTTREDALNVAESNILGHLRFTASPALSAKEAEPLVKEAMGTLRAEGRWRAPNGRWFVVASRPLR